jgi:hypothetical protein
MSYICVDCKTKYSGPTDAGACCNGVYIIHRVDNYKYICSICKESWIHIQNAINCAQNHQACIAQMGADNTCGLPKDSKVHSNPSGHVYVYHVSKAGVAQSEEQGLRKSEVAGSIPVSSSIELVCKYCGKSIREHQGLERRYVHSLRSDYLVCEHPAEPVDQMQLPPEPKRCFSEKQRSVMAEVVSKVVEYKNTEDLVTKLKSDIESEKVRHKIAIDSLSVQLKAQESRLASTRSQIETKEVQFRLEILKDVAISGVPEEESEPQPIVEYKEVEEIGRSE